MSAPLLIDVGKVPAACLDHALEELHKALGDPPGDDPSIWRPHESSLIRGLVEKLSHLGIDKVTALQDDLHAWFAGLRYVGPPLLPLPAVPVVPPWASDVTGKVEQYLASKPPDLWEMTDWQWLVDALVEKHVPTEQLVDMLEEFNVSSYGMGAVQAAHGEIDPAVAERIAYGLPKTVKEFVSHAGLTDVQTAVLQYAKLRGASNVVALTNANRTKLSNLILDYQRGQFLGDKTVTPQALQTQLFDHFAQWNRDWRRIAGSELGENLNQGLIAALPLGTFVKRAEVYVGACAYCRKIDGIVMQVVSPDLPDKDGKTMVWVGKTNIGRSSAPNKRVGDELIPRLEAERWWVATGIMHPHCRGRWIPLIETPPKLVKG